MIPSYSDHAANERTFLAWVRTAITVMALGFVIERLDLFVVSLGLAAQNREIPATEQAAIHSLSVALVAVGILLIAGSSYRFVEINRAIDDQATHPFRATFMPLGMALVLLAAGVLLLLYLLRLI
jgi:putative membrane protein